MLIFIFRWLDSLNSSLQKLCRQLLICLCVYGSTRACAQEIAFESGQKQHNNTKLLCICCINMGQTHFIRHLKFQNDLREFVWLLMRFEGLGWHLNESGAKFTLIANQSVFVDMSNNSLSAADSMQTNPNWIKSNRIESMPSG